MSLGNNIRRDLVFDEGDAVAQLQLALLQPLQPQQIWRGRLMQRIDRGVEIAVLLLQPCELGFEFALILVGHGARYLKNAMRLRNVAEVERISSLPARCASWLSGGASEPAGSFRGVTGAGESAFDPVPYSRLVTHGTEIMSLRFSIPIDRFAG